MPRPAPRLVAAAAAAALAAAAFGACGSSSSDSSSSTAASAPAPATTPASGSATTAAAAGGSSKVTLSADPGGALKFDKSTLNAKSGKVTVTMINPKSATAPHGIAIEGNGVDKDGPTVQPGGTSKVTLDLKPGTYSFYCPVPGHEAAGMKGTLTVS